MKDDDAFPDDIARIEARIEALREQIARCRKIALAARLTIGAGALWLAFTLLTLVPFSVTGLIAAIAAAIGGVVLAGSNATTWNQTEAELAKSEAMRSERIGQREMRVVGESRTLH
jgi:hypothetical protein